MGSNYYPKWWGEIFKPFPKESPFNDELGKPFPKEVKKEEKRVTFKKWCSFNKSFIANTKRIIVIITNKSGGYNSVALCNTVMTIDTCLELFGNLEMSRFGVFIDPFDENSEDFGVELFANTKKEEK